MKATLPQSHRYDFDFPELATRARVEECGDGVVIRMTRDTFSAARKAAFVRELVAEGFIAEDFQWFSGAESGAYLGVHWVVDASWAQAPAPEAPAAEDARFVPRIVLAVLLLWAGLLAGHYLD